MKLSELFEYALTGKEPPEGFPAVGEKWLAMLRWEVIPSEVFPSGSGSSIETIERLAEHFASLDLTDSDIEYFTKVEGG